MFYFLPEFGSKRFIAMTIAASSAYPEGIHTHGEMGDLYRIRCRREFSGVTTQRRISRGTLSATNLADVLLYRQTSPQMSTVYGILLQMMTIVSSTSVLKECDSDESFFVYRLELDCVPYRNFILGAIALVYFDCIPIRPGRIIGLYR